MLDLPGYKVVSRISKRWNSIVYRGVYEEDGWPCILKVMREKNPTDSEKAKFKREFDIIRQLNIDGVVSAYRLENYQNRLVMILEDFGGESLKHIIAARRLTPAESLTIMIKVSEVLGRIHQQNIVHKDIKSSNIAWNPETKQVRILDFGISSEVSRGTHHIFVPDNIQGTLLYISPEQAGRMGRTLDYRTDIYSLGVTMYEMVTGRLPFEYQDNARLMHAHVAKTPVPPHKIEPEIPRILSDIVMKLMSKEVEDRYQSTYGLKQDLLHCLEQLETRGRIEGFQIARNDISERLQISEKLYGRDRETDALLAAFGRVAEGEKEILLVKGYSGIGKSVLVQEVQKKIVNKSGYFLSGKFDQFKRNIPYFSLVQAFQGMVRQILSEPQDTFIQWKNELQRALGPNGRVIIDVIPEIELIIGTQPDVPVLSPQESRNRFNLVFQNFIRVFAMEKHPLVLFLDDLQWADPPSIKMIRALMHHTHIKYLLIIGAYRDNEVTGAHPLMQALREFETNGAAVHTISLAPLEDDHVNQLISDTLKRDADLTRALSLVCRHKTQGNPFFLNQFLYTLYTNGQIELDRNQGLWKWDIDRIKEMTVTDNVIDLMRRRIRKLPEDTRHILKLASCIGNTFDLKTLAVVCEKSLDETSIILWDALKDGLIITPKESCKFLEETNGNPNVVYRFLHDGVQQASYAMILEDRRCKVHLKIGRLMLANLPEEDRDDNIFSIVNQLNIGKDLISDEVRKKELAALNLEAGIKAKRSAAYEAALSYFKAGMALLPADTWDSAYDLTLALYTEATEAAYLIADFQLMNSYADIGLDHARTLLDKVRIYEIRIFSLNARNKLLESIGEGLRMLKLLKDPLPEKPNTLHMLWGLIRTKFILNRKTVEELSNLREMTDPEKLAVMRIIGGISTSAFLSSPKLLPLIPFKAIQMSVKYGCAPETAYLFGAYGIILCGVFGEFDAGYQYGRLCLMLGDRPSSKRIIARTRMIMEGFIRHWKHHTRDSLKPLLEAYRLGLDTGDIEYAVISIFFYLMYAYYTGKQLEDLHQEFKYFDKTVQQFKQKTYYIYIAISHQVVLCMMGKSETPFRLSGTVYDESRMLPVHKRANDRSALFYMNLNKMILNYFFENYESATECGERGEEHIESVTSVFVVPVFYFYDSLSRCADVLSGNRSNKKRHFKKIRANQKQMKKWAVHAPMNFQHKYDLVKAEVLRINGSRRRAMDHYEKAITTAGKNHYIQEQALGYELAAKFFLGNDMPDKARAYMTQACHAYRTWGAHAKADALKEKLRKHPHRKI